MVDGFGEILFLRFLTYNNEQGDIQSSNDTELYDIVKSSFKLMQMHHNSYY